MWRLENTDDSDFACLVDDGLMAFVGRRVRPRLDESVMLRRHVCSDLRHLRGGVVVGLLGPVPLLGGLRVAAEPLNAGRLRPRLGHRLRAGVVVLDARLLVPVAAEERLLERRPLDLHHHVAVLHAV